MLQLRIRMLQLKTLSAATKTQHSQINIKIYIYIYFAKLCILGSVKYSHSVRFHDLGESSAPVFFECPPFASVLQLPAR